MRLIELRSEKLKDSLALSFSVKEEMSWTPSYELELVCSRPDLDLDGLLGDQISIDISQQDGSATRTFNAYVFEGVDTGQKGDQYTYSLKLGSWLSFLKQNQNCRIYQDLSAPEIVEAVFRGYGFARFEFNLARNYDKREYCVQFRESDLAFASRLLEDEGIYYFIRHDQDGHTIVLSDTQVFVDQSGIYPQLDFNPDGEEGRPLVDRESIQRLQRTRKVRPNAIVLRDFNYHVPSDVLQTNAEEVQQTLQGVQLEYYDYAEGYYESQRGEFLAKMRLLAWQAEARIMNGKSNAKGLVLGQAFSLSLHPDSSRNRRYFLLGTEYEFVNDLDSTMHGDSTVCKFTVLPDDIEFHPLRRYKKPTVPGIQSATVVGPQGVEVHTDALGRIRVHFHWDRYTTTEENSSCWMRVSQTWAGKGWGTVAIPRVGQEVMVTYVDGDLDRPLMAGIVYNGELPPPYDLPKDIRYSGLVSRSLSYGDPQNSSQITFDDLRGAERVMIHAERDYQQTVERNSSTAIDQDSYVQIARTLTQTTTTTIIQQAALIDITGVRALFTGAQLTFTGVCASFVGANIAAYGLNAEFVGQNIAMIGSATSFIGSDIAAIGSRVNMIGLNLVLTGESIGVTGISAQMTGVRLDMTLVWLRITGACIDLTGLWGRISGTTIDATGMHLEVIGAAIIAYGMHLEVKGVTIEATSVAIKATNLEARVTGVWAKITGVDLDIGALRLAIRGISIYM
ncbi:MAG: type secretion protein Rhs [Proteobacteria bacterium]|nr:type secretion protein Rhs [Pseudomonadota bacterium]